jgi:hypothetical protein
LCEVLLNVPLHRNISPAITESSVAISITDTFLMDMPIGLQILFQVLVPRTAGAGTILPQQLPSFTVNCGSGWSARI